MAQVEVITSVQRRRRWSTEQKQRIVVESVRSGRTVVQVARAYDLSPNQLFTWRRQFLAASLAEDASGGGFVPVQLSGLASPAAEPTAPVTRIEQRIEIRLPSGVEIRVGTDIEVDPLRRVLAALSAL